MRQIRAIYVIDRKFLTSQNHLGTSTGTINSMSMGQSHLENRALDKLMVRARVVMWISPATSLTPLSPPCSCCTTSTLPFCLSAAPESGAPGRLACKLPLGVHGIAQSWLKHPHIFHRTCSSWGSVLVLDMLAPLFKRSSTKRSLMVVLAAAALPPSASSRPYHLRVQTTKPVASITIPPDRLCGKERVGSSVGYKDPYYRV
jgi:hypothetical protein